MLIRLLDRKTVAYVNEEFKKFKNILGIKLYAKIFRIVLLTMVLNSLILIKSKKIMILVKKLLIYFIVILTDQIKKVELKRITSILE